MTHEEAAKEIVRLAIKDHDDGGWQEAGMNEIIANRIAEALASAEKKGRSMMCEHKERDEIGGDCEVCAEIVKEGGAAYKRGYEKGREDENLEWQNGNRTIKMVWNEAIDEAVKVAKESRFEKHEHYPFAIASQLEKLKR